LDLLLRDYAAELVELLRQIKDDPEDSFERGRRFGFAEAASLLLQETSAFGGDVKKLGLDILENAGGLMIRVVHLGQR
jgi:hypothetical protein